MTTTPVGVTHLGGKVVDGSALVALATGSIAMATWAELAGRRGTTLLTTTTAAAEARRAASDQHAVIDRFLALPQVVVRHRLDPTDTAVVRDRHARDGVFDLLASWVTSLSRERGWPALTTDPARLRRIDPDVEIDPA